MYLMLKLSDEMYIKSVHVSWYEQCTKMFLSFNIVHCISLFINTF